MKVVEVREQVRLPFRRCVELVLSGVKFRLFRAAITVGIIALAVAFLMTMVSESLIGRQVAVAVREEAAPRDAMLFWVGRLANPMTEEQLSELLAAMPEAGADEAWDRRRKELQTWGGLTGEQLEKLQEVAVRQHMYDRFFAGKLTESERRAVVGPAKGAAVYLHLLDEDHFEQFVTERNRIKKPLPQPEDSDNDAVDDFKTFLAAWAGTRELRQKVLAGNAATVARARKGIAGAEAPKSLLARSDPEQLAGQLNGIGFQTTGEQLAVVQKQADLSLDVERIQNVSRAALFKAQMAARYGLDIGELDYEELFDRLSKSSGAEWFVEETEKTRGLEDPRMSTARISEAAGSQLALGEADLALRLARCAADEQVRVELQTFSSLAGAEPLSEKQLTGVLRPVAAREKAYIDFFDTMPAERREELLEAKAFSYDTLDDLRDAGEVSAFLDRLKETDKDEKFPDKEPGTQFKAFMTDWQKTEAARQQIRTGRQALADAARKLVADRGVEEAGTLAAGDAGALLAALAEAGLEKKIDPARAHVARRQVVLTLDAGRLKDLMKVRLIKERLATKIEKKNEDETIEEKLERVTPQNLLEYVSSQDGAQWLRRILDRTAGMRPLDIDAARVEAVAEYWVKDKVLSDIESSVAANVGEAGSWGFSGRTMWLLVVSFIVCVVGIANAMLMSVTERFREIATMKCLGATDGFIMLNFVLESSIQGIAGGVIGTLLGLLLGTLRGMAMYGTISLRNYPLGDVLSAAGVSLVAGVVISALAAVYPAWVAARLAPMEAMRIE